MISQGKYQTVINSPCRWSLFFIVTVYGHLFAQERKNIEIVDSLVIQIWEEVEQRIQMSTGDTLFYVLSGEAIRYQDYLAVQIGNFFKAKQFCVFRNYDPAFAFQGLVLEINRFNPAIEYSKSYRKKILGRDFVRREMTLVMQGQVRTGKLGEIIDTINIIKKYQDEIYDRRLPDLESSIYPFTLGQRKGYSLWQSVLEPILAVATVSLIIYMFYTQRS